MFKVLQTICSSPDININPASNNEETISAILKRLEQKSSYFRRLFYKASENIFLIEIELHIYLLINTLDGMNFRNVHTQNIFKLASDSPYVHILATIDHIHGPLSELIDFHHDVSI